MRRMIDARDGWIRVIKRLKHVQRRSLCANSKPTCSNKDNIGNGRGEKANGSLSSYEEAYRQLDKLDFMSAAKIVFTTPPKKKKFGIDFHLVQLFFACLPSLAVYLVAQYARYEMRRMEAELELKKKAEEAAKVKETESNATEGEEAESNPEILKVKERLDKLEETIKEIVVESKKQPSGIISKSQEDATEKRPAKATEPSNSSSTVGEGNSSSKDHNVRPASETVTPGLSQETASSSALSFSDASLHDHKETQNKGAPTK